MRRDASNKNDVRDYAQKVRDTLGDPRLQDVIERAAVQVPGDEAPRDKIAALLSPDIGSTVSSGGGPAGVPYLSRAPLVSMVQTHLEEALGDAGVPDPGEPSSLWSRLVHSVERDLRIAPGSFTPDDPDWYVFIAKGVLERLAEGNAPFNAAPAEYDGVAGDARLVVVGAVEVARFLVRFGRELGYETIVIDGRASFATTARFPDVDQLIVGWPDEVADQIGLGPRDAVAVLTHDVKFDEPAIVEALRRGCRYVGAVGSRKTQGDRRERLREAGLTDAQLDQLRGPVGLDLGGRAPAETALAIIAEVVAERRGGSGRPMRERVQA